MAIDHDSASADLLPGWEPVQSALNYTNGRPHSDTELTRRVCAHREYVLDESGRVRTGSGEFVAESITLLAEALSAAGVLRNWGLRRVIEWSVFDERSALFLPVGMDAPHVPHEDCRGRCRCRDGHTD
ncbi:hypothetical protein [Mycolicibacterium austroafricanum]|uniref:hypothetical protein n=1 Tax=Mycolicibacterium austroafricanum TaxID=39687 RepID=UPI0005630676|nr:hypothetical protein [Mycolicibacterium austroafricanum]